jgi:ubiquitin C-terminal hydrolase
MHSRRYTGQVKQAFREWKFKLSELERFEASMSSLASSQFACSAHSATQFLRGELFIFVDCVMTYTYAPDKLDYPRAVKFLANVIEFIVKWLQYSVPRLRRLSTAGPTAYLTDGEVAVISAWPEVNFTLSRLFADDTRCSLFFKQSSYTPPDYSPSDITEMKFERWSKTLLYLANYFAKLRGFHICLAIFQLQDEEVRPSLEFMQSLPVIGIISCLTPSFAQLYLPQVSGALIWRLQNLNLKELKEFNRDFVMSLLEAIGLIGKCLDRHRNPYEVVELLELQINLKLVTCPFLEKRVKGMNELSEIINRLKPKSAGVEYKPARWLTSGALVKWLEANNVVELLFSENSHLELIKRASEVLAFISSCNKLTERHLDLIWSASQAKHESLAKQTYTLLIELLPRLSVSQCDYLFSRMQEVPLSKYDEKFLRLIKDFTLAAFVQVQQARRPFKPYGVPLLQLAMLDSSPIAAFDLASELLSDIMSSPFVDEISDKILYKCTMMLTEGDSVVQCLTIMTAIISSSRASRFSFTDPIKHKIIELDTQLGGVIPFVLENVAAYISAAKSRAMQPCNLQNSVVQGRYIHKVAVQRRFSFLDFIVLNSKQAVSFSQGDIRLLWALFVENSPSQEDSEVFYRWLYVPRGTAYPFSREMILELFCQYLTNPQKLPFASLSVEGFNCFWMFFLLVNMLRGAVEIKDFVLVQRTSVLLEGYTELKELVLQAEDANVAQLAIKALVSLHMKVSRTTLVETWQRLIDESLDLIDERRHSFTAVTRVLELLTKFIDDRPPVEEETERTTQILVRQSGQIEHHKTWIDLNKPLASLRHRLAHLYRIPAKEVRLTINGVRYTWLDDDLLLNSLSSFSIVNVERAYATESTPKDVAAQSQRVLDTLFQLLSEPNASYSELAWNLLSSLPTSIRLKNSLAQLDRPVADFLDTSSPHKLLYCMSIIADLAQSETWNASFIRVGGFEALMNVALDYEFTEIEVSFKFHSLTLGLLRRFLGHREVSNHLEKFMSKVLGSLEAVAKCCTKKAFVGEDVKETVQAAHFLIKACLKKDSAAVTQYLIKSVQFKHLVKTSLLESLSAEFSRATAEMLIVLPIKERLTHLLVKFLELALSDHQAPDAYFGTLSRCIGEVKLSRRRLKLVSDALITALQNRPSEKSSQDRDIVMHGILRVLFAVSQMIDLEEHQEFLHFILHTCLFEVPLNTGADRPPKCKNLDTRHSAFLVLLSLCNKPFNLEVVLSYLGHFHKDPHWRTGKTMDWNYSTAALEKSETGFVGLKNLGSTCYMNSTLQNLFMMPSFRAGIMNAPAEDGLLRQLQLLFASLQHSDRQYINPKELCAAYTDWEGQPIDVKEQKDVFEFAITFMDKLESLLKGSPLEQHINQHFGGLQANEFIGKGGCSHRSGRDEAFLILPLEVKDKKSIIASLSSFVEGEPLEGENAYQCDHCEAKVSALKRSCIRHLPNTLILALRRFEFNYDTMQRVKLNDYCEFPMDLDMHPFTLEGLEQDQGDTDHKHPESYYKYRLKGVLIHLGTADSGHYYTYIQSRDSDQWIEFNDTLVKVFDPSDLPTEAFGGEERLSLKGTGAQEVASTREKYSNAYMLFYEREVLYRPRSSGEHPLELLETAAARPSDYSNLSREDNLRYWRCRSSFSPEYFDFVYRLTKSEEFRVFKFVVEFCLTILLRAKDRSKLLDFFKYIQQELSCSVEHREWLLEVLTVPQTAQELLLDCPILEVRRLIIGLVKQALRNISGEVVASSAARLLSILPRAKSPYSRYYAQYFHALACVVIVQPQLVQPTALVHRLLCHILNEPAKFETPPFIYKHQDIWLGYDTFTPSEPSEDVLSISEKKGSHFSYLLFTLEASFPYFSPEEVEVLKQPNVIRALTAEGFTKIGARAVSRLYLALCQDDLLTSKHFLRAVVDLIGKQDFDNVVVYFRQINQFLKARSGLQELRVDNCLTEINEMMKQNRQFYKFTEVCIDSILRLATRVPSVRVWFVSNREFRWLDAWLTENFYPPTGAPGSKTVMHKSLQWSYTAVANPRSNSDKVEYIRRLFKGSLGDRSTEWDSDDDYSQQEVRVKQRFDTL